MPDVETELDDLSTEELLQQFIATNKKLLAVVQEIATTLKTSEPELLRPAEAAEFCGVSLAKFNELVGSPRGPKKLSLGGMPVYSRTQLKKYIENLKEMRP